MAGPGRQRGIPRDAQRIPVPAVALGRWLTEIDDPAELKVALRVIALSGSETGRRGAPPSVSLDGLVDDGILRKAAELGSDDSVRQALAASLRSGRLIAARVGGDTRIWVNDERIAEYLTRNGLTALEPSSIAGTTARPERSTESTREAPKPGSPANIFALYEQHIGTFGHGMAEQLRAAEEEYPASWIHEAFAISAEQNVRSWGYVHAILRRWLQEGKPAVTVRTTGPRIDQSHDYGEPGHDPTTDSRTGYLESYRRRYGRLPWESDELADGNAG